MRPVFPRSLVAALLLFGSLEATMAAGTNLVSATPDLPNAAGSVIRMLTGLAFVLALFFGGVWLFKNWQRLSGVRSHGRLKVLETRSMGPRQGLYVVGYDQQRFLLAASPSGISLISALPEAPAGMDVIQPVPSPASSPFAQVLQSVLGRK